MDGVSNSLDRVAARMKRTFSENDEKHDDNVAIRVKGLRKNYKILKDGSKKRFFNPMKDYTVIDGIDLEIKKGEVVGVLGRNGCGKSTFLKLVSKVLKPTEGTVELNGKVASILEMAMGFHGDLSGRENIILRSELYGIPRLEAMERLEDIVKYADLGEFIDNPVRTYSSGMRARLAFSVMVSVDADIFLVDEALSTGDMAFASKASEHLKNLTRSGKTVLFTSHSMGTIESTCTRAVWIEKGKIIRDGPAEEVCAEYNRAIMESFDMTVDLAEGGAPSAQYRLATYYRDGKNVEKDYGLYIKWLKEAASKEHTIAMSEYAGILMEDGTDESFAKATEYYKSAADSGNYDARRKYSALISGSYRKMPELRETYRVIAENGTHFDMYRYGDFLYKTALKTSDYREAFEVLSAAEAEGNLDAKFQVAMMCRDGHGTEKSIETAVEKFEELALVGHPRSMTILADLFLAGSYVPKDEAKAFSWYMASACIGNAKSQYQVAVMYRDGRGVEKNDAAADEWFGRYSESLVSDSMLDAADALRYCSEETPLDQTALYLAAADCYNMKALARAASAYEFGKGVEKDPAKALEYKERSAKMVGRAKVPLADCYLEGRGVEKDPAMAASLYRNAADTGDADAMYKLALMYKDGIGMEPDDVSYRKYLRLAAQHGNKDAKDIVVKWDKRNAKRKKAKQKDEPSSESD